MSNIVEFPSRDRVEVWSGISGETGKRVWIFDMIIDGGACCIHDTHSLEEARRVARELRMEGNIVIWKDDLH